MKGQQSRAGGSTDGTRSLRLRQKAIGNPRKSSQRLLHPFCLRVSADSCPARCTDATIAGLPFHTRQHVSTNDASPLLWPSRHTREGILRHRAGIVGIADKLACGDSSPAVNRDELLRLLHRSSRNRPSAESSVHREGSDDNDGDEDHLPARSRKMKAAGKPTSDIRGLLQDFLEQQHRLDVRRREALERHAQERTAFERQWRQSMQRLERERLMLEQAWMEREEQRRVREEARAERNDELLTTLLNRLLQDDDL